MIDKKLISIGAKIRLARRDFFYYCKLKAPTFYKEDREYIVKLCKEMQDFYESDEDVLIINMPPRHGKSFTATNFVEWLFGHNVRAQVMTASYNNDLSKDFSKEVRNTIQRQKDEDDIYTIVYNDIFPNTKVQMGSAEAKKWSLIGGFKNYLSTSPGGSATGSGATYLIIDDLIKNAYEAHNDKALEGQWKWFTDTMLSRLEKGGKIIIIMTRWTDKDIAGRALKEFPKLGFRVRHICMKALQDDGTMLCEDVLDKRMYDLKTSTMSKDIAEANYNQNCINLEGRLYTSFKTYSGELPKFKEIRNYTDTADTGSDYLCTIVYGVTFGNEAYVLDVYYTQAPMEVTEKKTAEMLMNYKVSITDIESNNGGRGFARSIERYFKEWGYNYTQINTFHQSKNKESRILTNATWVMDHIYFPEDWGNRWPEYFESMYTYQREGKNEHDDAQDATTGIAEKIGQGSAFSFD